METSLRIVNTSRQSPTIRTSAGDVKLSWHVIPADHADPRIRALRPGSFAKHPDGEIVYVHREGRADSWERLT